MQVTEHDNALTCFLELPADLDTPVSTYLKLARKSPYAFLLESVESLEKWGRYSFIGASPEEVLWGQGKEIYIKTARSTRKLVVENPLDYLKEKLARESIAGDPALPPFQGGYVGYFGYDCVRLIEELPETLKERRDVPQFAFIKVSTFIVYDNLLQKMRIVAQIPFDSCAKQAKKMRREAAEKGESQIKRVMAQLAQSLKPNERVLKTSRRKVAFIPEFSEAAYVKRVERVKAYIREGDVFQTVLSMEFNATGAYDPVSLYRVLRTLNPSPYLYLFKFDRFSVVGSSPEIMVRKSGDHAVVRPIAGTRRRGKTLEEDHIFEAELRADPKENAEHVMLLDLGRNDLGRVCAPGTVRVGEQQIIERYSHVMHLVSQVEGRLRKDVDAIELFKATFPAGTLSGAPKVRAMEVIEELEKSRRGIYGGAIGYLGFDGNMDMAIAIRTLVVHAKKLVLRAGAGIVQDSVPKLEYQECKNKARALVAVCERLSNRYRFSRAAG